MKKGLFLLLAIITLGTINVRADVAAPVLADKEIRVQIKDNADPKVVADEIQKIDGVFYADVVTPQRGEICKPCEECKTSSSETLSDNDIKNLRTTTYLIYITLGVLVILMIIVIALLISKRKKDSKKDA